ncbi:hypothetical protein [Methylobacterium nigriterrae]|uniref:hypothetical protein n=1 Tax=Methylobacterium nigriterrae TaxID=3127512 RepID=UPI0030132C11
MTTNQTVNELLEQGLISQEDVAAAVDAAAVAPSTRLLPVGMAYTLNLASFLRVHPFVAKTLRDPDASQTLKRAALSKVILTARLEAR